MTNKLRDNLLSASLLLAGVIWGLGFIGVEFALRSGLSPALINALRFSLAGVFVLVFFFKEIRTLTFAEFKMGILPGLFMMGGFLLQATSQTFTSPSNVAFFTALYIIFVPYLSKLIFKSKIGFQRIVSAILTFIGIGVLSLGSMETGSFGIGEILATVGAFVFAMHFISLEKPSKAMSPIKLTFMQMFVASIGFWAYALIFDFQGVQNITSVDMKMAVLAIGYLGIFSSFGAYIIQTNAQKYVSPSKAAILMSTECPLGSTFSVMFGFDTFTLYLLIGGAITTVGVILTEVRIKWFEKADITVKKVLGMKVEESENVGE